MKELKDEVLMSRVREGDLDLLRILFERHHKHIFNFLFRMCGDKMQSEDITQEVFYNVMKYRSSYNDGKFVSWLFTIARNCMKRHLSKIPAYEDLETAEIVPLFQEKDKDYTQLHLALNKLDPSDKEVLVLSRFQNMSYVVLAEVIGSTEGAVKSKVSRALKKLRDNYFQNG